MDESQKSENDQFWSAVERHIKCQVPMYIKNLLKSQGFDNALALKKLDEEDVNFLEVFAKSEDYRKVLAISDQSNLDDFYGSYCDRPKEFQILRGHRKMLIEMVAAVQNMSQEFTAVNIVKLQNNNKRPARRQGSYN